MSASLCLAADDEGRVTKFDGAAWSTPQRIESNATAGLLLSCVSTTFCVAGEVNDTSYVLFYDGSAWSKEMDLKLEYGSLTGLSCATTRFCAAVTYFGRAVVFNAKGPRTGQVVIGDLLAGISCPQRTFCMAVSGEGYAVELQSGTWGQPDPIPGGGSGNSVSCPTDAFCAVSAAEGYVDESTTQLSHPSVRCSCLRWRPP